MIPLRRDTDKMLLARITEAPSLTSEIAAKYRETRLMVLQRRLQKTRCATPRSTLASSLLYQYSETDTRIFKSESRTRETAGCRNGMDSDFGAGTAYDDEKVRDIEKDVKVIGN
jgi:hypothetical protein